MVWTKKLAQREMFCFSIWVVELLMFLFFLLKTEYLKLNRLLATHIWVVKILITVWSIILFKNSSEKIKKTFQIIKDRLGDFELLVREQNEPFRIRRKQQLKSIHCLKVSISTLL